MSFQRNKSKNNHEKDSNGRSTSPGGYSVSQLFGSSPKRRSPPQRSATTQQLSSTPPKYDDNDLSSNRSTPTPTAAVPVPPGRTFMKVKLPSSSAAVSAVTVGNNSPLIKDSHSPSSGVFVMNQGKFTNNWLLAIETISIGNVIIRNFIETLSADNHILKIICCYID